jgi:hypothetical protein
MTDSNRIYHGSCACGAVRIEYYTGQSLSQQTGRTCQCSFCSPRQSMYLSNSGGELHVLLKDPRYLYAHRFASRSAAFMHCAVCNEEVYVLTQVDGRDYGLVNAKALDERDLVTHSTHVDYEGEALAQRLQRRANAWIPLVKQRLVEPD